MMKNYLWKAQIFCSLTFSRICIEFLKTTVSSFSGIVQFKKRKFDLKRWTCVTFLYSIPNWVKYNGSIFVDCSWYIINFTLIEIQALLTHFNIEIIMNRVEIKFRLRFCFVFCQSVQIRKFPLPSPNFSKFN